MYSNIGSLCKKKKIDIYTWGNEYWIVYCQTTEFIKYTNIVIRIWISNYIHVKQKVVITDSYINFKFS